ncbi:MAG: hypothetical protein J6A28_03480 [Clostridia bacterium]|nr:hypothetical protein [Clostridia bacterium]
MEKQKVVFTFVEAGMGHIVPATGIADAFEKKYGEQFDVIRWKIFSDSQNPIIKKYSDDIIAWVKMASKNKLGAFEEKLSYFVGSKFTLKVLDAKFKKAKEASIDEIVKMNPALICSTYYSPSHFTVHARMQGKTDPIIATYTPDPVVYPSWDRGTDIFFVNNESAEKYALKYGFKESQLYKVPFILRKEIESTTKNKKEARRMLGLAEDKFTLLMASGAYGTSKDKKVIDNVLAQDLDINFVVVCGKNEELYKYCEEKAAQSRKTAFHYVGFTNQMFVYNSAADLMMGKTGANSMMESFYFGVPFIATSSANLLEQYICKYYIKDKQCGEKIFNPKKVGQRIAEIVENPAILEAYKKNLRGYQDSSGAERVADKLYEMLKAKYQN